MIFRRTLLAILALCALIVGVGCSDRADAQLIAETDDPFYVQGLQLKKQGRNSEALAAFLKVIERRGERGSAESHLDAGTIYLNHTKDPILAVYHFRKYLELQPNSKEALRVRGMVDAANREYAKTLPARPMQDQSLRMGADDELKRLQKENEELRAVVATLRGGEAMPISRAPRVVSVSNDIRPPPVLPPAVITSESPILPAPNVPAPRATTPAPPVQKATTSTPAMAAPAPTKTAPITRAATNAASPVGRTYKVMPKDTLYAISTKFYGHGRNADAIFEANRNVMRTPTDLKIGMTLKLP